tara:strand:- start:87 stop:497 length:411 start_codon:yes stop_codon:yes gene_type:complete
MPRKVRKSNWTLDHINELSKLDNNLGTHASRLSLELISALNYKNWVTCIILSATIIDVINYEESSPILRMVGLDKNSLFSNSETYWLRQKRNSILHYQKPVSGLINEKNASCILEMDAKRSSMILLNILKIIGDEV